MIRTQIQLEDYQFQWLKAMSREKGVSMSKTIRESVDLLRTSLEHSTGKQRAMAAVGRFSSSASDVSENHDKYLAEAYAGGNAG